MYFSIVEKEARIGLRLDPKNAIRARIEPGLVWGLYGDWAQVVLAYIRPGVPVSALSRRGLSRADTAI